MAYVWGRPFDVDGSMGLLSRIVISNVDKFDIFRMDDVVDGFVLSVVEDIFVTIFLDSLKKEGKKFMP